MTTIIAIILIVVGIGLLIWQYHKKSSTYETVEVGDFSSRNTKISKDAAIEIATRDSGGFLGTWVDATLEGNNWFIKATSKSAKPPAFYLISGETGEIIEKGLNSAEFVSLNPSDNNSTQAGKVHVMYVVSRMISGPVLNNDGTSEPIGTAGYVFYEFVVSKSPFTRADVTNEDKFSSGELVKTGFSTAYYRSQGWGGNGFALGVRNYIIEVQEEDADEFLENRSEQRLTPMRIKVQEQ